MLSPTSLLKSMNSDNGIDTTCQPSQIKFRSYINKSSLDGNPVLLSMSTTLLLLSSSYNSIRIAPELIFGE